MSTTDKRRTYTVVLEEDAEVGGYTVTVPALPGVVTEGDTVEQALAMAREAIELYIETLTSLGEAIPEEAHATVHVRQVEVAA